MFSDPTEVFGEVEAEARGLRYGAMVFTVKPGGATSPHQHASEETWLVQEGLGRAMVSGQDIGLIPGTRLTVPAGALHSITNTSTGDLTVISFWWREVVHGG
ncbi:cupin domain-containing protein [Pyxidicoccus trucidator]|uniref:cupin domain-containing protein n=1 Tax=Pyxidicoccus trucidator TaxID=2709662 RepID=UPI0013DC8474|nr:cupin domain-containing protein [Pyxidicoccus trucidator]